MRLLADGVAYAHRHLIVHRDIKPSNLMIRDEEARVLDFGLAAALDPDAVRLTRTGDGLAGDSFSAPELLDQPHLLDARCDIYSIGACWHWMLTGRTTKGHAWEQALDQLDRVGNAYRQTLLRCLHAQIDKRYQSVAELLTDLDALLAGSQPAQRADSITDDEAVLLGALSIRCLASTEYIAWSDLIRHPAITLSPFRVNVAFRKLARLELVTSKKAVTPEGDEYTTVALTDAGAHWLESACVRVEALLDAARDTPAGEVPF